MYSVEDIANYFLSVNDKISPKKIQKLIYFSYSWYLALMNEKIDELDNRLFENRFEAWIHGPVDPVLYQKYKEKGASYIDLYTGRLANFLEEDKEILDNIWDEYGGYTANQLESISHQHDPWKIARQNAKCSSVDWCDALITDVLIFDYYTQQLA